VAELSERRELWPEEVKVLEDATFQNGRSVRKGQIVRVEEVRRNDVVLDDGAMFFPMAVEDTNLMKKVARLAESLTPEQLALTLDDVRRRPELWPVRVTLRWAMKLDDGSEVPVGQEVVLLGFERDGSVSIGAVEQGASLSLDPWGTDVFARARDRAMLPDVGTVPFPLRSLESMLEPAADGSTLGDFEYVVVYDGRDSCPRATVFAPELAAFQEASSSGDASWQLVLANAAHRPPENREHYAHMGLEGRLVRDGWGPVADRLLGFSGPPTPWVRVYGRDAATVATVSADGESTSPRDVLATLAASVEAPARAR
jgi:hypothetical protein